MNKKLDIFGKIKKLSVPLPTTEYAKGWNGSLNDLAQYLFDNLPTMSELNKELEARIQILLETNRKSLEDMGAFRSDGIMKLIQLVWRVKFYENVLESILPEKKNQKETKNGKEGILEKR